MKVRMQRNGVRDMAEIIEPAALNERFTIYLNTEGNLVQRTLREMTADEVLLAEDYAAAEADWLQREAAPAVALSIRIERGERDVLAGFTCEQCEAMSDAMGAAREALDRVRRLMVLVNLAMPRWRGSGLTFGEALRR
jgi:hypothetical protein